MTFAPEAIVTPPPATPASHGLIASSVSPTDPDDRWMGGLVWQPELCNVAGGSWVPCPVDANGDPIDLIDKSSGDDWDPLPAVRYTPFVVELESVCAMLPASELAARAVRQLEAYTPKYVEEAFWTGVSGAPGNFTLAAGTSNLTYGSAPAAGRAPGGVLAASAVSAGHALDLLAEGAADGAAGSRAMIHVPARLGERWARLGYLERDGVKLVTRGRGDVVAVYAGSVGSGPVGHGSATPATDQLWAYVTPMTSVRLSTAELYSQLPESLHHRTNKLRYRVERSAAVTTEGCYSAAVLVDVSDPAA